MDQELLRIKYKLGWPECDYFYFSVVDTYKQHLILFSGFSLRL